MTQKETTNMIIALQNEGWQERKITAFLKFIETHNPSEAEAMTNEDLQFDFGGKKHKDEK